MTIRVQLGGGHVDIETAVFEKLLGNSVMNSYPDYEHALDQGQIVFRDLLELARRAQIPYPLFFATEAVVEAQLAANTAALLQGVPDGVAQVNSRDTINIADIELIVKDLRRKQRLVRTHDRSLPSNPVLGRLAKSKASDVDDAATLLEFLGVTTAELHACSTKQKACDLFIERLEANHVLVSISQSGFMPQSLLKVKFSGITVKDPKVPYIFVASGTEDEKGETPGRQLLTLALLSAMIARKQFAAVVSGTTEVDAAPAREYGIASEMLMPTALLRQCELSTLDGVQAAAQAFKVTPSAIAVRAATTHLITWDLAREMLAQLREIRNQMPKKSRRQPKPVNAVRKYNGKEFSRRMLRVLDEGGMSPKDFLREATGNRLQVDEIDDFRRGLA